MSHWISARISQDLYEQMHAEAKELGTSFSSVLVSRLNKSQGFVKPEVVGVKVIDVTDVAQGVGEPTVIAEAPAPAPCLHPKARIRVVAGGKRCLDCGAARRLNESF